MDSAPVHIVVDDREKAGRVPAALKAGSHATVAIARLDMGDYRVERRVVVERKTAADFAASLIDGRLFQQAAALAAAPERAVLLLEGTGAEWRATGVRREALQGALITMGVFYGVTILRSGDPQETARLLVYLGRQAQRCVHGGLPRSGYRPKGKRARQLFRLQGLPGVGPERAARLLERFGSVQSVMTAPADDLAAVDGIGERTAAKIRWALEEPRTEFGAPSSPTWCRTPGASRRGPRGMRAACPPGPRGQENAIKATTSPCHLSLSLDEGVPIAVAEVLRRRKVDVLTTKEAGNEHASDAAQLEFATAAGRCIVTRNVKDLVDLAEQAVQQQRPHAGIVLISSAYRGNEIRRISERILRVARANPRGLEEYGVRYL